MKKIIIPLIVVGMILIIGYNINFNDNASNFNQKINNKIDLKTATINDLTKIPGIGYSKAKNIIDYREKHGFNTLEDLLNVSGIGVKTFNSIEKYLYLSLKKISTSKNLINLNNASLQELKSLQGIGDVYAKRIIEYRKFKKIENEIDLINIGIPKNIIEDMKRNIEY